MSPLETTTTTTTTTTHHVLDGWPRHGPSVEVLLQEGSARVEIAVVELVRDAPSQGTELSTLLEVWADDGNDAITHDEKKNKMLLTRVYYY